MSEVEMLTVNGEAKEFATREEAEAWSAVGNAYVGAIQEALTREMTNLHAAADSLGAVLHAEFCVCSPATLRHGRGRRRLRVLARGIGRLMRWLEWQVGR